jgi:hypothetical protein
LWRLLAACLLLGVPPAHAGFDAPLKKLVVQVWRDVDGRSAQITVTCYYYLTFMVKVTKGDRAPNSEHSAIEPGSNPRCEEKSSTEYLGWGSFRGVVGGFIFFDGGSPGDHGEQPFSVSNSQGHMILDWRVGDFQSIHLAPGGVVFRYRRLFRYGCSLYYGGATECWGEIKAKTALTDAATPECRDAYEAKYQEYKKKIPEYAKDVRTHSVTVSYNVEARYQYGKISYAALPGPAACWPSY